jgi:hypothetical protein
MDLPNFVNFLHTARTADVDSLQARYVVKALQCLDDRTSCASGAITDAQKFKSLQQRWFSRTEPERKENIRPGRLFKKDGKLYMVEAVFKSGYGKYRPCAGADLSERKNGQFVKILIHACAMIESLINGTVTRSVLPDVPISCSTIDTAYIKVFAHDIRSWCDSV